MLGAQETELLGAPPRETNLVVDLVGLAELDRGLEDRSRAGTVVVDARAVVHAVEVGAHHDDVVGVTGLGLGGDVEGLAGLHRLVEDELHRHWAVGHLGEQGLARRLRDAGRRSGRRVDSTEGAVEGAGGVVVDDDGGGADLVGHLCLLREGAGATADERDLAGEVGPTVGSRVTALHVDGRRGEFTRDAAGAGALAVAHRVVLDRPAAWCDLGEAGRVDLLVEEVEVLTLRAVTGRAELLLDVGPGGLVAGGAGAAVAVVGVGDALEGLEVAHDALGGDSIGEFARAVGVARLGGSGRNAGGDQPGEGQGGGGCCCASLHTHVVVSVSSGFPRAVCRGPLDPRRVGWVARSARA